MNGVTSRPADPIDPPELTDAERRVGVAIRELRRGASMQAVKDLMSGTGDDALDQGQIDTIDLLVATGPCRMRELAKAMRVDASTATRAVARLEQAGLVARATGADDGRSVVVRLTEAGAARHERLLRRRRAVMREVYSAFAPDELDELAVLLERLVSAFDRLVAGSSR